ncbi:MAG: helix-turn-helix domain-containing protein [Candidatus Woesearchaeota archaeon]
MIIQENFLKQIRSSFDLNIYEVKIWTSLLSRGMATAGELSDISNVPRSRSYDVLESLEKKSFIIMKLGKPIKYIAVPPEEIIKRVKRNIQVRTNSKLESLEKIKQDPLFNELQIIFKQGIKHVDPLSLSGSLKNRTLSYDHLKSLLEKAQKSVTIMTTSNGLLRKIESFKYIFKKLSSQGVKIKIAAPITERLRKELKEISSNIEVRHIENINGRFVIIDSKDLVMMLEDDKSIHENYDTAIWLKTPYFSTALENIFNHTWVNLPRVKL